MKRKRKIKDTIEISISELREKFQIEPDFAIDAIALRQLNPDIVTEPNTLVISISKSEKVL